MNRLKTTIMAFSALVGLCACGANETLAPSNVGGNGVPTTQGGEDRPVSTLGAEERSNSAGEDRADYFANAVGVYSPGELALIWGARVQLTSACMDVEGFDFAWAMPTADDFQKIEDNDLQVWERSSVELAATFGYHRPPVADPVQMPVLDTDAQAAFSGVDGHGGCLRAADDALFGVGVQPFSAVFPLSDGIQDYFSSIQEDPTVMSAHEAWRACMADAGLDSSVMNHARFRDAVEVTPEEISVAVIDSECRGASGFTEARRAAGRAFISEWSSVHAEELQTAADGRALEVERALATNDHE